MAGSEGDFLRQLTPPGYVVDLRPQSTQNPPAALPPSDPVRAVLVLSRTRDPELGTVTKLLRKAGVPCLRVDADRLTTTGLLTDPARLVARLAGRWLAPTVTWFRHFSVQAIGEPASPARRVFAQESWAAAADGLAAISPVAIRSARPGLLAQLLVAAQHGIEVPQTFVTTAPGQVADLLPGHRVVVKAVHQHFVEATAGRLTGVFPAIMQRNSLSAWSRPGPPVIVQEYVEHEAELRVYYVQGQLHGFSVSKQEPADLWLNGGRVAVSPATLSPAVATAASTLAKAFRFRLAAFDFLVRDGSPVFLEADPRGDWRWIELRIGAAPVSEAVAAMLCDLHRAQLPGEGGQSGPGEGAFSLLEFLAG